jgi:spore coat polysaccharide biosynthesis predicted glycosyltransferase SpsG
VVLGPGAARFDIDWAAPGRVIFLEQPAMAAEMRAADLVITSAGRTVFEAAATGTPAIVLAQNTRETTHSHLGLDKGNLYLGLGRLVTDDEIVHAVTSVLEDEVLWSEMSAAAARSVDGLGARRIARIVDGMIGGL